jgi:hypothetical protein
VGETIDEGRLRVLLPGAWRVAASNFPIWLSGERLHPRVTYEVLAESPLVLGDEVSYRDLEGAEQRLAGQNSWRDGHFVRRAEGRLRLARSRWAVSGCSEDGAIVVVQFEPSRAIPDGVDIMVRSEATVPELRRVIARSTEEFGLSPEQFGSLTWLESGSGAER